MDVALAFELAPVEGDAGAREFGCLGSLRSDSAAPLKQGVRDDEQQQRDADLHPDIRRRRDDDRAPDERQYTSDLFQGTADSECLIELGDSMTYICSGHRRCLRGLAAPKRLQRVVVEITHDQDLDT